MVRETRVTRAATRRPTNKRTAAAPPLLDRFTVVEVDAAYERLARQRAVPTLVRGGLPLKLLRRLLRDAVPPREAAELPDEVWASLAAGIAVESPDFALTLAEELHDHLGWDREPADLDDWWPLVVERPLEALWNAALSGHKGVRREFAHIAQHCLENYRASPACLAPSWDFVDGILDIHARQERALRDGERRLEDAERRLESERERLEELREELRRQRRENAELLAQRARAEKRGDAHARAAAAPSEAEAEARMAELERRARKAEKERDHLWAELERARSQAERGPEASRGAPAAAVAASDDAPEPAAAEPPLSQDPNPRRRVIRMMLRKLVKKGKIGAAHTHEDNVYRGVPDHEKGVAKEAMDLLYREGFFVPKPTVADPHVSISPERLPEVQAMIAGRLDNPRLQRFCEA